MMTTTKNSKRKNQPNGVDINQFPKLVAAIDEAVASGLLNGVEGAKSLTHMVMKRFVEAALQGEMQAHLGRYSVSCYRRRRPRGRRGYRYA